MPNYYDNWKEEQFDCSSCKWHGVGSSLSQGELTGDYFELLCPLCAGVVTIVMNPTIEEARANWDKLSELERRQVEEIEELREEFEANMLTAATSLPEIEAESFTLFWDFDYAGLGSNTLIKYGDTIIFEEPVIYEGYERFSEVAELLRARYGTALRDLIPTEASKTYLYGDRLSSPEFVDDARKRIFLKNV
jgi:hypothetical protein